MKVTTKKPTNTEILNSPGRAWATATNPLHPGVAALMLFEDGKVLAIEQFTPEEWDECDRCMRDTLAKAQKGVQ